MGAAGLPFAVLRVVEIEPPNHSSIVIEELPADQPLSSHQGVDSTQQQNVPQSPVNQPAAQSATEEHTVESPIEEPAGESPTEEPVEKLPIEEPSENLPIEESAEQIPTEEPTEQLPTEEPTEKPTEGHTEELPTEDLKNQTQTKQSPLPPLQLPSSERKELGAEETEDQATHEG